MNFYENFVNLCNQSGKSPSKVAQEVGISKSIVSRWKNGGGVTDATALKVAKYFDVPVSTFLGRDVRRFPYVSDENLLSPETLASLAGEDTKKAPTPEGEREIENQRIIEKLDSNEELRAAVLRFLGM